MKLVILAGGKGTRLGLADIPKPMAPLADKPILDWQIALARRYGVTDIMILTGHLSEVIEGYFGDGSSMGVRISYFREETPMGTAGAFQHIRDYLGKDRFLVFYGDVAMDFHIPSFIAFDAKDASTLGTLLVHPNNHPYDSDLVDVDKDNIVTSFYPKPRSEEIYLRNLVNAAVYILDPAIIDHLAPGKAEDWGRDIFPKIVTSGGRLRAYSTPEYIKDIGTRERLDAVSRDWKSGKATAWNLENRHPAVFLDRDGVIIREVGNLHRVEDVELLPDVAKAVRCINESGFLAVVVTNQPVVAKGWLDEIGLRKIHDKMETLLGRERAYLDAIYYCPHHPDGGFEGERPELKIACACRKPAPGMILDAAKDFNIDLAASCLIGDSQRDMEAGKAAGIGANVLVESNSGGALLKATDTFLKDAL